MNWWILFGCKLTGWSSKVLAQCSEASRSQLSKYTSALVILIIVWGIIGFCFAHRYIGLPWWACMIVSLFFVTIVVMIERQIILASEKTISMVVFRGIIAFIMAIVGSTIFDQNIFGKDIDKQMTSNIEAQVAEITPMRDSKIVERLGTLKLEIDSIEKENAILQAEINVHPFIVQTSRTTVQDKVLLPDGSFKTVSKPSVTKTEVPNPKIDIVARNNNKLKDLRADEKKQVEKRMTIEEDVRRECKENVGFLEELEAMWTIITTRNLAGGFYAVFFVLLMSLELFVVASNVGDKECDYDVAIKGAQRVRIAQFNSTFNRINNI